MSLGTEVSSGGTARPSTLNEAWCKGSGGNHTLPAADISGEAPGTGARQAN